LNVTPEQIEAANEKRIWAEYDGAAEYCALRGLTGAIGDPLPTLMSSDCCERISDDPEAFQRRVRECGYALSMNARL